LCRQCHVRLSASLDHVQRCGARNKSMVIVRAPPRRRGLRGHSNTAKPVDLNVVDPRNLETCRQGFVLTRQAPVCEWGVVKRQTRHPPCPGGPDTNKVAASLRCLCRGFASHRLGATRLDRKKIGTGAGTARRVPMPPMPGTIAGTGTGHCPTPSMTPMTEPPRSRRAHHAAHAAMSAARVLRALRDAGATVALTVSVVLSRCAGTSPQEARRRGAGQ
jgi:hypothetical protein